MDFGELKNDKDFIEKATNLNKALADIDEHMKKMNQISYESLGTEDKVKYDMFRCYAINSLFWMYLKLNNIDPAQVSL